MPDVNIAELYKQYFNCSDSYILDYIMKFEDQFRLTKVYNKNSTRVTSGYITEPNEIYRIYVSSEDNLKDILRGFFILTADVDVDKFSEFSSLIRDIITKLTRKRHPNRDAYEDDYYFATDDGARDYDTLINFTNEICEYAKPNSTEARMVIQWLILFKLCYNNLIDLEDIYDFTFAYDNTDKEDFHLFIWIKNQSDSRHFVFENSREKSILDISCWNEKEGIPKLKTFDLPLKTVVSEINKFKPNYTSIIVRGKTKIAEDPEDAFRDIFKIMVHTRSERLDILKHLEIADNSESEYSDVTKFAKFAEDLKDIIDNVISDRHTQNTQWFFQTNDGCSGDYVSRHLDELTTDYYKPRILEARLVIAWIVVYKLCKIHDLDRTKIEDLAFYYYPRKDYLRIAITIDGEEHKYGFVDARVRNILNMDIWKWKECNCDDCIYINEDEEEKEEKDKLNSFDLTVDTIASEIRKFQMSYENINLVGAGDTRYTESMLDDIFRVHVENLEDLKNDISKLRCSGNTVEEKFKEFDNDLVELTYYIFNNPQKRAVCFNFVDDNGAETDSIDYNGIAKYYKPNLSESRIALTWVVVYKLCKNYNLDRTKIKVLNVSYFHKFDVLSIYINIDDVGHVFRLPHAKERSVLNLFSWNNCTKCDIDCIYLGSDDKETKDEPSKLTPFSDFLKERLVYKWDNVKKYYVQIEGNAFQSDFNVAHAVIPLDYIPKEEYGKINDIILEIAKLSGQVPIFTAYPKDYCDNYVSHISFSRFDDDALVDYGTIESTDFTSLMIILATLEYHWMTKEGVAEWDDPDHFIINKTTSDVFYKQGFAYVRHSIINVNNRIIEWYIPGSKDDKIINQSGFGSIDSLALIKPTEQKSDKRKKLLKMMFISQMMNNNK